MKWKEKILSTQQSILMFIESTLPDGTETFFFFLCKQCHQKELKLMLANSVHIKLEEYGTIIDSGYGKPSTEVLNFVNKKYNTEFKAG